MLQEYFTTFRTAPGTEPLTIFKNPTMKECMEVGYRQNGRIKLRATIIDQDLYVTDPYATTHEDFSHLLPPAYRVKIDIWIRIYLEKHVVDAIIMRHPRTPRKHLAFTQHVLNHPQLTKFGQVRMLRFWEWQDAK